MCKNAKILIVEDSPINRDVLIGMLKHLGYRHVDFAENGEVALTILEQHQYDVVFMDCDMPVLDGYDTTKEIRRREQTNGIPHIPIIAITAHNMPEQRYATRKAGMDEHVAKPLLLKTLQTVLEKWIKPCATQDLPNSLNKPLVKESSTVFPAIDREVINRLNEEVGIEIVNGLLHQFIAAAPQQLIAMRENIAIRDASALQRIAHRLKGESLQIGAVQLATLCKELEGLASKKQHKMALEQIAKLESELERINTTLDQ